MSDVKVSALTALLNVDVATNDVMYIVDTSAGAGGSKKIAIGQLDLRYAGIASSMAIGNTITGATAGSVLFAGALGVLAQDNANFFWDDTNNRLGIGTATPGDSLEIFSGRFFLDHSDIKFVGIQSASAATAALVTTSTGNCTNGAHTFKVTYVKAGVSAFETDAIFNASNSVTVDATHKQVTVTIPVSSASDVVGRNIYASKVADPSNWFKVTLGTTVADNTTTTYTFNTADGSLQSKKIPTWNGTAGNLFFANSTTPLAHWDPKSGNLTLGDIVGANIFPNTADLYIKTRSTVFPALILKGSSGQTGDTFQIFDAGGSKRVAFNDSQAYFAAQLFTSDTTFTGSTGSEKFGYNAAAGGNDTAFGNNASATSGNSVAVGIGATVGNGSVGVGGSARATGNESVSIGHGWNMTGSNVLAIGGNGAQHNESGITIVNCSPNFMGDFGTVIGGAYSADTYGFAGGVAASAGSNGVAIGHAAAAAPSSVSIGPSAVTNYGNSAVIGSATTQASDQLILAYQDTYFNDVTGDGSVHSLLHSPDAASADQNGGDFSIVPGMSRGLGVGGNFFLRMTTSPAVSGSGFGTTFTAIATDELGKTTFQAGSLVVPDATGGSVAIAYQQGTTGYATDGSTTRAYTAYAYKTIAGTKIFSTPGLSLGTAGPDDNSTVSLGSSPSGASASDDLGLSGYVLGDVIDYQIYAICEVNGNTLYNASPANCSDTISNLIAGVDVSWTDASYPAFATSPRVRILRQVNAGGYNDYKDVAAGTMALADDSTGWTGGGLAGSTSVQNFFQNNMGWTPTGTPDGFLIYRSTNGGAADATDVGNVTSFTDTGTLPWADPTTITPTSLAGKSIILAKISSPMNLPAGYPTSPSGLDTGDIWVDTGAGNVIKVV